MNQGGLELRVGEGNYLFSEENGQQAEGREWGLGGVGQGGEEGGSCVQDVKQTKNKQIINERKLA